MSAADIAGEQHSAQLARDYMNSSRDELRKLSRSMRFSYRVERDVDAPSLYSVWLDDGGLLCDELVAAADVEVEAIDAAIAQIRSWGDRW